MKTHVEPVLYLQNVVVQHLHEIDSITVRTAELGAVTPAPVLTLCMECGRFVQVTWETTAGIIVPRLLSCYYVPHEPLRSDARCAEGREVPRDQALMVSTAGFRSFTIEEGEALRIFVENNRDAVFDGYLAISFRLDDGMPVLSDWPLHILPREQVSVLVNFARGCRVDALGLLGDDAVVQGNASVVAVTKEIPA